MNLINKYSLIIALLVAGFDISAMESVAPDEKTSTKKKHKHFSNFHSGTLYVMPAFNETVKLNLINNYSCEIFIVTLLEDQIKRCTKIPAKGADFLYLMKTNKSVYEKIFISTNEQILGLSTKAELEFSFKTNTGVEQKKMMGVRSYAFQPTLENSDVVDSKLIDIILKGIITITCQDNGIFSKSGKFVPELKKKKINSSDSCEASNVSATP